MICIFAGIYGICKAYEGIRLVGFGEYRPAIELTDGKLIFFDIEIKI